MASTSKHAAGVQDMLKEKPASVQEICTELGISMRTAYRALEEVRETEGIQLAKKGEYGNILYFLA